MTVLYNSNSCHIVARHGIYTRHLLHTVVLSLVVETVLGPVSRAWYVPMQFDPLVRPVADRFVKSVAVCVNPISLLEMYERRAD